MSDLIVQPLAEALLACLCEAVQEQANPPQNCCLRVGTEVAADMDVFRDLCCEGLAYVALGDQWVSVNSFPEQDIVRQANTQCGIGAWAVELKVGIMRCVPTGTNNEMPTCTEWTAAAINNIADAKSLRRAACCFIAYLREAPLLEGLSVVVNRQIQAPVQGGCTERSMSISVQIPNCDCPPLI